MKNRLLLSILLFTSSAFAQENNDSLINVCIDRFFEGLNEGDTNKVKSAIWPDALELKTIFVNKYGNTLWEEESVNSLLRMVGTLREEKYEERLLDRKIHCEDELAMAWLPYEFYVDGKYSHEGVNMIQFAKSDGEWVIISIIDSRRRMEKKL